ncbi:MAG: HDOD domain-containing protein [Acidobacteriota bacterium]|nr:HDOD domain-containing protein [Acidobacteriota bacterium]
MPALKQIERRLLTRLPAFSPVAVKLLSVLADERPPFKEIARLIALDPILAGEVLRLANSGLYGRWLRIQSLFEAIARLGTGRLSQVAITAALWRGLPRKTAPFVREWWRHSIAAALLAQQCAAELPADHAYTATLLHGIGQLALFEDAPNDYPNIVEIAYAEGQDLLECERESFHVDHAALAGLILESWGLPETLCDAVAKHHELNAKTCLAEAVQTACKAAEHLGFGRCGCHEHPATEITSSFAALLDRADSLDSLVVQINQIECSLG